MRYLHYWENKDLMKSMGWKKPKKSKRVGCQYCPRFFARAVLLRKHMKTEHPCLTCIQNPNKAPVTFAKADTMRKHYLRCHSKEEYEADYGEDAVFARHD